MRVKLIFVAGLLALFVAAQNVEAGLITVTKANDYVQLTNKTAVTYTGTGIGRNTISDTAYNASGSLTTIRSGSSLDYLWSATPDIANTEGVGIIVTDFFTLSSPAHFQLTFTGSGYASTILENVDTKIYVQRLNYGHLSPYVVGFWPPGTLSGSLMAGNYELYFSTGTLPNGSPVSGEVLFADDAVPEPSLILLLGLGLGAVVLIAWRRGN